MPSPFEPIVSFWRGRIKRISHDLRNIGQSTGGLRVDILSGMHAPSQIDFAPGKITIGGQHSDDVMLLDDAFEERSLIVETSQSALGLFVRVSCDQGNSDQRDLIKVNDHTADSETERLPCTVEIGDVRIALSEADVRRDVDRNAKGLAFPFLLGAVCLFGLSAIALQSFEIERTQQQVVMPSFDMQETQSGEYAEVWLNERLIEKQLDHVLTAEYRDDVVEIRGTLPSNKSDLWQSIHEEYDLVFSNTQILSRVNRGTGLPQMPAVAAVRILPTAALVLGNGEELKVGTFVGDGWEILKIAHEFTELRRGADTVVVEF